MFNRIGITGPSRFTPDVVKLIENHYEKDFVMLFHNKEEHLLHWLDQIDALILIGGTDLHPRWYTDGVQSGKGLSSFDLARDRREFFLFHEARKRKMPVLGICRGHQLIGASYGIPFKMDLGNYRIEHSPSGNRISLDPETPAHKLDCIIDPNFFDDNSVNIEDIWVNSFHHQGLYIPTEEKNGRTLLKIYSITKHIPVNIVACSSNVIEIMEGAEDNWMSVQFHPEYDYAQQPISNFIVNKFYRKIYNK